MLCGLVCNTNILEKHTEGGVSVFLHDVDSYLLQVHVLQPEDKHWYLPLSGFEQTALEATQKFYFISYSV
jgi:hypothetical protein